MSSKIRSAHRWALLLLVLTLVASSCGGDEEQGESAAPAAGEGSSGGEFSVYIGEPEHLAPPADVTDNLGSEVLHALYSPLVEVDVEAAQALFGEEAPGTVAENIESDDNRVWRITLKDGWTFHDGTPVTAQSYVDTWNYGARGTTAATGGYFFERIAGYDALQCEDPNPDDDDPCPTPPTSVGMSGLVVVDDRTFEVTLKEPFSQFPLVLGYTAYYPAPVGSFTTEQDADQFEQAPIGNGPFMMDGVWEHNQRIRVRRYDNWGGGEPARAAAVEFRIYAETDTAFNDLLAGNLDMVEDIPGAQQASAQQEFGDNFIARESGNLAFLGLPVFDPRFQNPDLRHAISMAIDRQAIADTVRPDFSPASSIVPPAAAGSQPGVCGEFCEYDPEGARELLAQAGGWQGPLTLFFNSGADHDAWMEAVSNNLRQNLGITDIQFQTLDFAEYQGILDDGRFDGPYRLAWIPDYPIPLTYLESLLVTDGSSNYTGYANPAFDRLVEQGSSAETIEDGFAAYQEAERLAIQDMPMIPMFYQETQAAWSERLSNVNVDFFEHIRLWEVEVAD